MKHIKLFESFSEVIDEKKDQKEVTSMDRMRISDIISKAGGDWNDKSDALATRMANAITNGYKALRRALAAESENWHEMAQIFFKRASALGVKG